MPIKRVLPNGLTVILQEASSAPVVALQMWVKVGSADETDVQRGLAHVHEHMLFKGTARRGVGEIAASVEAAGGDINAWTSYDQTVYHLVLASRFLDEGLDILADAVLASSFDEEALASELEVVLDEIRRSRDLPSRMVHEQLFATAYERHPYRYPIIGTVDKVQALTRQHMLDFYGRWYVPGNMVLVVAGDIETEPTLARIEALFGAAPAAPDPRQQRPLEPAQQGLRLQVEQDEISETHLCFAFHIPDMLHDDVPALDLLAVLLGQGESSRLSMEVKRRQGVVTDAYAYAYTPRDPGLFIIGAATPPDKGEAALEALLAQVFRLHHEPVSADDLARAKQMVLTDLVYQKETVEGVARKLGYYEAVAGDLGFEERYHQRLAAVSADELQQVTRRWLRRDNMSVSLLLPKTVGSEVGQVTDATQPAAGPEPAAALEPPRQVAAVAEADPTEGAETAAAALTSQALPDLSLVQSIAARAEQSMARRFAPVELPPAEAGIHRVVLDNGLTLLIQEDHSVPVVAVRALFLGGQRVESPERQGIENMLARLLTRGTSNRSGEELSRAFDRMGGAIGGFSGRNSFGLRAEFLAGHLGQALELFAECLLDPTFPPEDVARERSLLLEEIHARDDNLASLSFRAFRQLLFGEHPYAADLLGEEETVSRLDREALRAHFETRYTPARATVTVVGDVDPAQVARELNRLLGGPSMPGAEPPQQVPWQPPQERQVTFRYRDRNQAHVVLGFPGAELNSEDRFPLELLATVLGGQGGRLFVELRDHRAMAYSLGAMNLEGLDPGYFAVYIATAPERVDEAVEGIIEELRRLRDEQLDPEELRRAQQYLIGTQAINLQRSSERAATIGFNELYGLGHDDHLRYAARIESVTPARLQETARRYLDLERYSLAVVMPEQNATTIEAREPRSARR